MCFFLSEYYIMVSLLVPRAAFSALNTKAKEIRGFFLFVVVFSEVCLVVMVLNLFKNQQMMSFQLWWCNHS